MSNFKRENRYIVIKIKDAVKLGSKQQMQLANILADISQIRKDRSVAELECVVVESTWPEYQVVWEMIKNRICGAKKSA